MNRAPRRPRHPGRHGPPSARSPQQGPGSGDPAVRLRALVEEGIVTAAALNARDDLELAAASTERLGALTSGMWRALSRELATAAERLDRSTMERMDDIRRRAAGLNVEPDDVIRAGVAAAHLAEHRETVERLLTPDADNGARILLGPNLVFGCGIDVDEPGDLDDDDADADEPSPLTVRVSLFLWPAPLAPAEVTIVPTLLGSELVAENVSLNLGLVAPAPLLDAVATASGLSTERVSRALSSLGVACWTAHQLDEDPQDDDEEEEEEDIDDDVAEDDVDGV